MMTLSIGSNIRQLRLQKNITQEQLAEAMQVTCAAVSKWERGESYPDITLLQPLAYYFNITLDELMGYQAAKIEQEIETILSDYASLYYTDSAAAKKLITHARQNYPQDCRILHRYMWNLAGDLADNDITQLLFHKEELLRISRYLLEHSQETSFHLDALNIQAKLLWADGNTNDALAVYQKNFVNWYDTVGQKSEQLFSKDSSEFLYWVRKNMYELAAFAADKLVKAYFYDTTDSIPEKLQKLEYYGDAVLRFTNETKEPFFGIIAYKLFARLCNDLKYRTAERTDADLIRITDKYLAATQKITELSETDAILHEVTTAIHNTKRLLPWVTDYYLSAKQGINAELLQNPAYKAVLRKYESR